ncbi:MAG: glycosyltransferase [Alphaproteobacteria bacterium]|nr:glycosyltransferase [Alphaproteobacteria bacterium]
MKVFNVMAGAAVGGAETAFAELVSAQKSAGFDVHAVCRPSARNAALREAGVPLTELPFGGFLDFTTTPALKKLIATEKPDVVVTWMNRAAKKLPRNGNYKWIARLGGYYDLKYYNGVDHFVVNAPDIGRWMREQGVAENKISFIPNFAEVAADAAPVSRASLDTPENAFVFLALGRLHTNKAFDILLKAMADVPDAYLWLAGEGPERKTLETLTKTLNIQNRVRFLGWRDDRWSLLAACDAFVFPSRHEPFGNSFMQAWAAGRALITTNSQGPSYYVRNNVDALVTPVDDVEELAKAMKKIAADKDLREKLAVTGKLSYAQAFDKTSILTQWQRLFSECSCTPKH